jgi:5-methylcytosine-specific restriction enzyme A
MPQAPLRYCVQRGCGARVPSGYCLAHQPTREPGVHYGRRWGKARLQFLADCPFCAHCQSDGQTTLATEVDHIIPHKGKSSLFWDRQNWQPLCRMHHNRKTAIEDGGFVGA